MPLILARPMPQLALPPSVVLISRFEHSSAAEARQAILSEPSGTHIPAALPLQRNRPAPDLQRHLGGQAGRNSTALGEASVPAAPPLPTPPVGTTDPVYLPAATGSHSAMFSTLTSHRPLQTQRSSELYFQVR